jgi:hypothetical protein
MARKAPRGTLPGRSAQQFIEGLFVDFHDESHGKFRRCALRFTSNAYFEDQLVGWVDTAVCRYFPSGISIREGTAGTRSSTDIARKRRGVEKNGISREQISFLLANVLPWWDKSMSDIDWLPSEKAERVKVIEFERLRQHRALWRDRLVGDISRAVEEEKQMALQAKTRGRLAAMLTTDEMAEYELRSSPAMGRVQEWTWGLDVTDEQRLWLTQAEVERETWLSRSVSVGVGRVGDGMDAERGEIARVRTVLLALPAFSAARYLGRADPEFLHWAKVLNGDLGVSPEKTVQLYLWRRSLRYEKLQLERNQNVSKQEEGIGLEEIMSDMRAKVERLLGETMYHRYARHELGRWLRDGDR